MIKWLASWIINVDEEPNIEESPSRNLNKKKRIRTQKRKNKGKNRPNAHHPCAGSKAKQRRRKVYQNKPISREELLTKLENNQVIHSQTWNDELLRAQASLFTDLSGKNE